MGVSWDGGNPNARLAEEEVRFVEAVPAVNEECPANYDTNSSPRSAAKKAPSTQIQTSLLSTNVGFYCITARESYLTSGPESEGSRQTAKMHRNTSAPLLVVIPACG